MLPPNVAEVKMTNRDTAPKAAPGKYKIGRTIMFTPDQLDELLALAHSEGRPLSVLVNRLVEQAMGARRRSLKRAVA